MVCVACRSQPFDRYKVTTCQQVTPRRWTKIASPTNSFSVVVDGAGLSRQPSTRSGVVNYQRSVYRSFHSLKLGIRCEPRNVPWATFYKPTKTFLLCRNSSAIRRVQVPTGTSAVVAQRSTLISVVLHTGALVMDCSFRQSPVQNPSGEGGSVLLSTRF